LALRGVKREARAADGATPTVSTGNEEKGTPCTKEEGPRCCIADKERIRAQKLGRGVHQHDRTVEKRRVRHARYPECTDEQGRKGSPESARGGRKPFDDEIASKGKCFKGK